MDIVESDNSDKSRSDINSFKLKKIQIKKNIIK